MTGRIFRTSVNGGLRVGLEFDSDAEFEEFLGARGVVIVESAGAAPPPAAEPESRSAGRPSDRELIAQAIDELGDELDSTDSIAAQARLVRDMLALTWPADNERQVPAPRTIEIFLTAYRRPIRGNSRGYSTAVKRRV